MRRRRIGRNAKMTAGRQIDCVLNVLKALRNGGWKTGGSQTRDLVYATEQSFFTDPQARFRVFAIVCRQATGLNQRPLKVGLSASASTSSGTRKAAMRDTTMFVAPPSSGSLSLKKSNSPYSGGASCSSPWMR